MYTCRVTGIGRARQIVRKTIDKKKHEKVMEDFMKQVYELTRRNAAVLSGMMEAAVFIHKSGSLRYSLGCTAPQAVWNEFGTYFMPVGSVQNPLSVISTSGKRAYRPFMRPAMWTIMSKYSEIVKRVLWK